MKYPDSAILVFSKAPVAGQVNTRLIPFISAEQAADLHKEFTRDRLQMCTAAGLCEVQLWCSPDTDHPFFTDCGKLFGVSLQTQNGEDLGARMSNAIRSMLGSYKKIIIIGGACLSVFILGIWGYINIAEIMKPVVLPLGFESVTNTIDSHSTSDGESFDMLYYATGEFGTFQLDSWKIFLVSGITFLLYAFSLQLIGFGVNKINSLFRSVQAFY